MPGTGNVLIDAVAGVGWLDVGLDNHLTYFFDNSLGFHNWTESEKTALRGAFQAYANVADITFEEVTRAADADLVERWVSNAFMVNHYGSDYGGYHYYPFDPGPALGNYNRGYSYWNASLLPGSYAFETFVHEIGHGLGLAHPHDTDMDTLLLPGVTLWSDLGTLSYNQTINTVMSYNDGATSNPNTYNFSYKATPMAFDIAALQFLYGANTTAHAGDDVYLLPDLNTPGIGWSAIWDTGGFDTIRYDGTRNAVIDLRAATLVDGDPNAGGYLSRAGLIYGGFTIANGVTIESAIGGGGNDRLTGNDADNSFTGNGGNDAIDGGGGFDSVHFAGVRSNYGVSNLGGGVVRVADLRLDSPDGTDLLVHVERLVFADDGAPPAGVVWAASPDLGVRGAPVQVAGIGDLDGDGTSDVLWRDPTSGRVDAWHMANGQWAGSIDLGTHGADWQVAGIGDLDGDRTDDVLWRNPTTGATDAWRMADGQWAGSTDLGSHGADWQVAGIGDFDGDATADILWRNPVTGAVDEWQMAGGNWSASIALGSHGTDWQVAGIGDFNGDFNADVLWRNATTGQVDEWLLVNGQWSASVDLGTRSTDWQIAAVGDHNNDGMSDVFWRNPATGQTDIWIMNFGQWAASQSPGTADPRFQLAGVGDFDHNGTDDALWRDPVTGQTGGWLLAAV